MDKSPEAIPCIKFWLCVLGKDMEVMQPGGSQQTHCGNITLKMAPDHSAMCLDWSLTPMQLYVHQDNIVMYLERE